jgi:hypothetical protein
MLQRTLPAGFITPSLPTKTTTLPSSSQWLQARRLPHHRPQERQAGERSANGDRWLLAIDSDTDRVFVRHEPNLPSGGQVADIEIGAFLIAAGNGSEKQELLRMIGTLV